MKPISRVFDLQPDAKSGILAVRPPEERAVAELQFAAGQKSLSLDQYVAQMVSGIGGGQPTRVNEPYTRVDAVFACIFKKWTSLDSIPWLLFDERNELVTSGPQFDLLQAPHPQITRTQFLAWSLISLDQRGKAFFWIEADDRMTPIALWPLVPQNMTPDFLVHPETGTKVVGSWRYASPSGKVVTFLPEELLTFRYPHPTEWWNGLARLDPGSLAVTQYQRGTEFQARSFENDGMVSGIMKAKAGINPDQIDQAKASWQATYGVHRNAKKTAFMGSDWDYTRIALTPQELDFLNSTKWSLQRICFSLGVPQAVLGITGDGQLGAGKESQELIAEFWKGTQIPLMSLIESSFVAQLFGNPRWNWPAAKGSARRAGVGFTAKRLGEIRRAAGSRGVVCLFDRDSISALTEMRTALLDGVKKLFDMGVPPADAFEFYDLGLPDRAHYHRAYLPFSVSPIEESTGAPAPSETPVGAAVRAEDPFVRLERAVADAPGAFLKLVPVEDPAKKAEEDARARRWRSHNAKMDALAKKLRQTYKGFFYGQRSRVLAKLSAYAGKSGAGAAASGESFVCPKCGKPFDYGAQPEVAMGSVKCPHCGEVVQQDGKAKTLKAGLSVEILFELTDENARLIATLKPLHTGGLQAAGADLAKEIGTADTYELGDRAMAWLKEFARRAQKVNETTRDRIQAAIDAGDVTNTDSLADAIRGIYRDREDVGARAAGEADAVGLYGAGRDDAMGQFGIEEMEWLSARDDRVRPTHAEADGQVVMVGEPFKVGADELRYPGDPQGSLAEIMGCRCVAVPKTSK